MESISGIIEEKSSKSGTRNDKSTWTRTAFKIDGRIYSTFSETIAKQFNSGDLVALEFENDGKFNNIKKIDLGIKDSGISPGLGNNHTKIEVFEGLDLQELKKQLNEFNQKNNVIATQCYKNNGTYDAIVYFKS